MGMTHGALGHPDIKSCDDQEILKCNYSSTLTLFLFPQKVTQWGVDIDTMI